MLRLLWEGWEAFLVGRLKLVGFVHAVWFVGWLGLRLCFPLLVGSVGGGAGLA